MKIPMTSVMGIFLLKNYADKTAATLVDNSFKGFTQFQPCIAGHSVEFVVKTFVHKLMKRSAENV